MARVHADIDALKAFKAAVDRFQYEQRQVLGSATREIETTRGSLERKADKWQRELGKRRRALDACQREAAAAARAGRRVDCSSLAWAVSEAEERLANVRSWQARIEQEISAYNGERSRFHNCVEADVRRAIGHLSDVIKALIAARATQISGGSS